MTSRAAARLEHYRNGTGPYARRLESPAFRECGAPQRLRPVAEGSDLWIVLHQLAHEPVMTPEWAADLLDIPRRRALHRLYQWQDCGYLRRTCRHSLHWELSEAAAAMLRQGASSDFTERPRGWRLTDEQREAMRVRYDQLGHSRRAQAVLADEFECSIWTVRNVLHRKQRGAP